MCNCKNPNINHTILIKFTETLKKARKKAEDANYVTSCDEDKGRGKRIVNSKIDDEQLDFSSNSLDKDDNILFLLHYKSKFFLKSTNFFLVILILYQELNVKNIFIYTLLTSIFYRYIYVIISDFKQHVKNR